MSGTYKATGINLKSMPLGESDRLVTILTREFGLVRAVAPGSRKHKSTLGGRSGLFVVNELLIAKGRSLDKITQAETLESYPGLSQDLGKLAASQYMAELVMYHALSDQPQEELFCLLNEHLRRLECLPNTNSNFTSASLVLAQLSHCIFHLLALAGIAPQVQVCCITQEPLQPDFTNPDWQAGFSIDAGGIVSLPALALLKTKSNEQVRLAPQLQEVNKVRKGIVAETAVATYETDVRPQIPIKLNTKINAVELSLLQQLAQPDLPQLTSDTTAWGSVELILRQYIQYHFGRAIRSAALMDTCLSS